jgi:transposase
VIQHVREKLVCRACEAITQPPAPSHPIARGRAGPKLLAHVLFAKYGLHLPLHRQSDVYQREGIDLDVSTLADWVGASAATLMPLVDAIRSHVFAAERIHADDTTVPVLAKGKTRTGRLWTYVRDDRPFAGPDPPAAVFFYSPDRGGAHPAQHPAGYAGLMQADAYAGFGRLYEANRKGGPIVEAACWAHGRRKFFDLARLSKTPIAAEAVKRIDVLFAIEREINGLAEQERLRVRQERSHPLIVELRAWLREQRAKLSRSNDTAKAINYSLNRWDAFTRFLEDGRLCMSNNAAERELRAVAVGRRNWTFAGSDEGGRRAAAIYTLIATAKLSDIDPQAWLADVLARINDHAIQRLGELLPWNWRKPMPSHSKRREPRGHMRASGLSAADKLAVTAACQQLIEGFLKPRFLPTIRPTQFNYPVDILGKWHGTKYRFIQRYRSGFPENLGEEFDAPFARLDWISRNRFDVKWHRHTGEWFCLHRGLTLAEAINTLRSDGLLHPP